MMSPAESLTMISVNVAVSERSRLEEILCPRSPRYEPASNDSRKSNGVPNVKDVVSEVVVESPLDEHGIPGARRGSRLEVPLELALKLSKLVRPKPNW